MSVQETIFYVVVIIGGTICLSACSVPGFRPDATSISGGQTPSIILQDSIQTAPSITISPSTLTATATLTEINQDMVPFSYVDSVADLLSDPYGRVRLFAPEDGSLWLIPTSGYEEQSVARWETDNRQIIFIRDEETKVTVDEDGRAWVVRRDATQIEMWEGGSWTVFGIDQGWADITQRNDIWWAPKPWSVASDAHGKIWLPTQGDIRVFDGSHWTIYTTDDLGFSKPEWEELGIYHTIAFLDDRDQIWVSECHYSPLGPMGGNGVRWFDSNLWQGLDSPIGQVCVSLLTVAPSGNVWIGVEDAIWRYQPVDNNWTFYHLLEASLFGFNFNHPIDILINRDGDAWVIVQLCGGANCDGESYLYRIHAGEGSVVAGPSDWLEPPKKLFAGRDGRNWLLWEGVFYQIVGGDLVPIVSIDPRGITIDPAGRVWVLVGKKEEAALWVLDVTKAK